MINRLIDECKLLIENRVNEVFPETDYDYNEVIKAARYSLILGGKRIRPLIMLQFCKLCDGKIEDTLDFALALEMIHTYSLIHDDLPCMDDDDYRRGKLTNHKVYGEAVAVLAGDALLTKAFEVASSNKNVTADVALGAVLSLAEAAGDKGMVGGQILDINAETEDSRELSLLENIHKLKTGAMIKVSAKLGCLAAGVEQGSEIMRDAEKYAEICHPVFREAAYAAMLDFAGNVKNYVQNTQFSVVKETLTAEEIEECKKISERTGVHLRLRDYIPPET